LRQHHVSRHQRFVRSSVHIAILVYAGAVAQGIGASSAQAAHLDTVAFSEMGIASFYTNKLTASGERMDPDALTAAHRSLPFGTRITVTNHGNGRSAVVRINDRGPFVHGRVIDLSPAAARAIGVKGLALVSLSLGKDESYRAMILPDTTSKSDCGTRDCYDTTLTPDLVRVLARASAANGASMYVSAVLVDR
jgi:rare lipoprotein A